MDSLPPDFRLLRFSSDDYPPDQRIAVWRDVLKRKLLSFDVEPLTGQPFQVDATLRVFAGIRIGVGLFGPSINRRTREIVAADGDGVFSLINLEGEIVVTHGEAQFTLREGDCCFMLCSQEGNFTRPAHGRLICTRFDRAMLAALVPDLDACMGRIIRADAEALRLLWVYMRVLDQNQKLETDALRRLVIGHIYDLAALVLNPLSEGAGALAQRGQGGARLRALRKLVVQNQDRADFSIADAAASSQLSPRQVQRLFESEGTTFSEYLLDKRLARVHAALTDRRQAHRGISEIALSRGFKDVSQFNRAFRRRYGASPSEVRAGEAVR